MRKIVTCLAAVTAIGAGAGVLLLKNTVQERTDEIKEIARQIHRDEEAIRVLEAEWAFVTAPGLLQEHSVQFLALMPPRAKQTLEDPVAIPFRPKGIDVEQEDAMSVILPAATKPKPSKSEKPKQKRDSL